MKDHEYESLKGEINVLRQRIKPLEDRLGINEFTTRFKDSLLHCENVFCPKNENFRCKVILPVVNYARTGSIHCSGWAGIHDHAIPNYYGLYERSELYSFTRHNMNLDKNVFYVDQAEWHIICRACYDTNKQFQWSGSTKVQDWISYKKEVIEQQFKEATQCEWCQKQFGGEPTDRTGLEQYTR